MLSGWLITDKQWLVSCTIINHDPSSSNNLPGIPSISPLPPLLQKYIYNHQNDIYVIKHNLDVTHTFTDEQWSVSFMNTHYNPPPPLLGINFFTTVCTDPQTEGYSCFTGETVLGVLKPILKILFEIFHINFSTRIYLQIKDIGWIYEISLLLSVTCCNALL